MSFHPFAIEQGLLLDLSDDPFPTQVFGWNDSTLKLPLGATHYGMITTGDAFLTSQGASYMLHAGRFFVIPSGGVIDGEQTQLLQKGSGLVISRLGYRGLWQLGGTLEDTGRLRYIDGCSDTLLVCPPVLGEPCLNHLHIPPHTNQSAHTHPSVRIGVILRGRGECHTPDGIYPLEPGLGWYIPTGLLHSFHTQDESLDVIAWHPDSDFGPTHENHPMINRTILQK